MAAAQQAEHPEVALASDAEGTACEVDETVDTGGHGEQGRTIGECRCDQIAFDDEEGEWCAPRCESRGGRSASVGECGEPLAKIGEQDAMDGEALLEECESRGLEGELGAIPFAFPGG